MNKTTLLETIKTNALELINTIQTAATEGRIEAEGLTGEAMEILEEVYCYLYGEDEPLKFRGYLLINTAWFTDKKEASERLGFDLTEAEEGYYYQILNGTFHKVKTEVLLKFSEDLKNEILKRNGRPVYKITVNLSFNEWDADGFHYTQAVKVPHTLKGELIEFLKTEGQRILNNMDERRGTANTQRRTALIKFIERLEDETTDGATWYALTNTERVFLEWFLADLINNKRATMKRRINSQKNTALIFS